MSKRRRWLRVLRALLLGLALIVAVPLAGVHLVLLAQPARDWVRDKVTALANEALGGKLEIDRIEALSIVHLRASGVRLFGAQGERLASLEALSARVNPLALLSQRLSLSRVRLAKPVIELGAPDGDGGGLLGFLKAQQKKKPAEPTSEPSAFSVKVSDLQIERGQIAVVLDDQRWTARALQVTAGLEAGQQLALQLERLAGELLRGDAQIGQLRSARADYGADHHAGVTLELQLAETRVVARAELGPADASQVQAVTAQVRVERFAPATLRALGIETDVLTAPVDLDLALNGNSRDLGYDAALHTPGGELAVQGRYQARLITCSVASEQLQPAAFLRPPIEPLSVLLRLRAERAEDGSATTLHADVERGSYGAVALPRVEAEAHYAADKTLTVRRFEARYAQARVTARGRVAAGGEVDAELAAEASALDEVPPLRKLVPDVRGALTAKAHLVRGRGGRFTARASVDLEQPALGDTRASALALKALVEGDGQSARNVDVELQGAQLQIGKARLPGAAIKLLGGPDRYVLAGRFADRGQLNAVITRAGERYSLSGGARVVFDSPAGRRPLHARIGRIDYEPDGALAIDGLVLRYLDASARVDGALDPKRRSRLRLRAELPHVQTLTGLFMDKPVAGALQLNASLTGQLQKPNVEAAVHYRSAALFGMKQVGIDVTAAAKLPERRVEIAIDARNHRGSLEANLHSRLRSSTLSADAFRDGEHEIEVKFQRFQLADLEFWPKGALVPIAAAVSGEFKAHGKLEDPRLEATLRSAMRFQSDKNLLKLALAARYADEEFSLELEGEDTRGPLVRTQLHTALTRERFSTNRDIWKRLLAERAWRVGLWLGARRIDELPAIRGLAVPEAAWPARVSAEAELAHKPGQEPEGKLQVRAAWEPPGQQAPSGAGGELNRSNRCGMRSNPQLELSVDMKNGELATRLSARIADKQALQMKSTSHAPIDEWFNVEPARVRPASITAEFSDLLLADLPIVCEAATGRVSGKAILSRALTKEVTASIDLHAKALRWGDAPPFDADLSAAGDRQTLNAQLRLLGAGGSAMIEAGLPLDGGGRLPSVRLDAEARAKIDIRNMDVRSLLGPVPNLRASAGRLNAALSMSGSLQQPSLQGQVELNEVTVTLAELGQRLERVSGKLTVHDRTFRLERTRVHDREGKADVTGEVLMRALNAYRVEVEVKADDFPIRRSGVMLARFDGKAKLAAEFDPSRTDLYLSLHEARVELTDSDLSGVQSLAPDPEIYYLDRGQSAAEDLVAQSSTPLALQIDATEPFWMSRSDFSVLVSAWMRIESEGGSPSIIGTVDLRRGYVELIGQSFDIEEGQIEFTGGHDVAPRLDLTAVKRAPGGKKVAIKASGSLLDPTLAFLVDDEPKTAGEALTELTGSRGGGSDGNLRSQMSSMATGLAAGVLTIGARRELGEWMPVLSIESGEHGPSLRAGIQADRFIPKFLRKVVIDAYVEGVFSAEEDQSESTSTGIAGQAAALLELRFPHNLVAEGQIDANQRWSVDLNWEP